MDRNCATCANNDDGSCETECTGGEPGGNFSAWESNEPEMTYEQHREWSPQFRQGSEAGEKVGAARAIEELKETLQEQFDAYPVEVFPEPDLERVARILAEHGIALDCVSASAIRAALKVTERIVNSVVAA